MKFEYVPKGVCSRQYTFDIEDDVVGMKIDDVIGAFEGVQCGMKGTSCPDQIAHALKAYKLQTR